VFNAVICGFLFDLHSFDATILFDMKNQDRVFFENVVFTLMVLGSALLMGAVIFKIFSFLFN